MDTISKTLHKNIIEYILHEIENKNYSADCQESLEVAKQCLETAWNIEVENSSSNLLKLFDAGSNRSDNPVLNESNEIDEEDRMAAERLKSQGNICMGENLFNDAVNCYSKAIELDPKNAVYYCNRAAAYSKLNKNELAIKDCQHAIKIDPKYGKAYSRQGLAYTAMNNFPEAIACYKKAIEIEPDNQNYKQNLQAAEERKSSGVTNSSSTNAGGIPNLQSALQNFDLSTFLNNPAMMNMAQQMMSQPEMRNMMSQMMSSFIPPGTPVAEQADPSDSGAPTGDNTNINDFLTLHSLIGNSEPVSKKMRSNELHYLQSIPPTKKKQRPTKPCRICSKTKIRRETRYFCPVCEEKPALCVEHCFRRFHKH